ncbi:hypothetical protein TNCV_4247021 [Trichonephila clavipes]|nr:hypothetical protein TNCV_4247021 [Trichonephila clavipes]
MQTHLPLIRTGISVKPGSSFVPPAVTSVSFSLQTLFFSFRLQKKKQQHSPSHCVFGAPRTRFGAVKPSLPGLFPSRPRDVTPDSSSFSRSLPPASPCGESEFRYRSFLFNLSPQFWV